MHAREELNKFKFYVHATGGKRFKFEDHLSFFSLSGCSITVHRLDHRHFHTLDVVVVSQIEELSQWGNLLHDSGNYDCIPPQTAKAKISSLSSQLPMSLQQKMIVKNSSDDYG